MQILHIVFVITFKAAIVKCFSEAIKVKCTNVDEFYYTKPESHCKIFYKCKSRGVHEMRECDPGFIFDFYSQNCTKDFSVKCHDQTCKGKSNGIYQDTSHACRRSYSCYNSRVTSYDNCPPKFLHNGQKCVRQNLVLCQTSQPLTLFSSLINDEYSIKNTINNAICENKTNGPHADPLSTDCSTYIVCKGGQLESQKRCSNQAIFNGKSCVPSPLYQCPTHLAHHTQFMDLCHSKPNGFYVNPQHGCSSYVRCMQGNTVEVNECPVDQYFDSETRKCILERFIERRRCYDRGVSLDCDGKNDGFYSDANCESYYYCHTSGYKTEYKCSSGKIYNGMVCVPKSQYTCPKSDGDSFCLTRPDGYYKDPNDGCRAYLYCSSGYKIIYLCEEGHFYDIKAKECVRRDSRNQFNQRCRADYSCYGKSEGYHVDLQSNCRNYVYCKNGEKITQLTCRDNNIFNGQKCVAPNEYACPSLYHRQIKCMPIECIQQPCIQDGFYPDLHADCREYFSCITGKLTKLLCPVGKRFNGEVCIEEDKFKCPILCDQKNKFHGVCPLNIQR